ncbi:MAG: hypothetical protein KDB82_07065 [Planctomycetes bacterium]|nr:hypothetical protein [Planctomycetota bacterium]
MAIVNRNGTPKANDDRANGRPQQPPDANDSGGATGDNKSVEKPNFPDAPENLPWDPADFENDRFVWRAPAAQPAAKVLLHSDSTTYEGRPTFLFGSDAAFFRSTGTFDPRAPDGMLVIHPSLYGPEDSREWLADGTLTAIAPDGDTLYRTPTENGFNWFAIPYSYARTELIGLKVTGPGLLSAEALVGQMGMPGTDFRRKILAQGQVFSVSFRLFPATHADFRSIVVVDGNGLSVNDAMLTFRAQIFGRSDATGVLRYPWPASYQYTINRESGPETKTSTPEEFFFVSAPGFVPVLLERSALENATGPVEVALNARELLVSAYEAVPDPDALHLGANLNQESTILDAGFDLIPVPDEWPEFVEWTDVQRALLYGYYPKRYDLHLANGRIRAYDRIGRYQKKGTGPYVPGHEFGGEGAEKLAQALGRRPTEHWAEYAHWYYGRWDYDEREGRFDVVLPFPGRFLLAVGEYNRGAKGDERNGKLTHVLYIDARNPAELKSKLLIHPMG